VKQAVEMVLLVQALAPVPQATQVAPTEKNPIVVQAVEQAAVVEAQAEQVD
jgi:hypothetical protein